MPESGDEQARKRPPRGGRFAAPMVHQPPPLPLCYPCPICGGEVREEHGHFRCTRCGQIVETCCEGAPPPS